MILHVYPEMAWRLRVTIHTLDKNKRISQNHFSISTHHFNSGPSYMKQNKTTSPTPSK